MTKKQAAKTNFGDLMRNHYTMAKTDGDNAEIVMYGNIVETHPVDYWTGEKVDGSYIIKNEFLEDLEKLSDCKNITIRMDSLGGDASVSVFIHNRLRELADKGINLTCVVDGVAMSGGSLIMCACDTVKVHPASLVMIHNCISLLIGNYNAEELRKIADANEAYDKSQVSIYKRKCGLSDAVIKSMMAADTYMTGSEAVEKGFADEIMEGSNSPEITASADGRRLFVRGVEMPLPAGSIAPKSIPVAKKAQAGSVAPADADKKTPETTGKNEGGKPMANTIDELRVEYPELTAKMMQSAAEDERKRLEEIDQVAGLFDGALVQEAKFGANACDARELAFRAAQAAAQQGKEFLKALDKDNASSGAQKVASAPDTETGIPATDEAKTPAQRLAEARAGVKALYGKNKED